MRLSEITQSSRGGKKKLPKIVEAPVGNLEVHNMDQPGTFPNADRRLLTNPAHIKKIRQRFEKVPFLFDLYFINQPGKEYTRSLYPEDGQALDDRRLHAFTDEWYEDDSNYIGETTPEFVKMKWGLDIKPSEAISVIYLSNANEEDSVSMTPWIIAHRFAHAITDADKRNRDMYRMVMQSIPDSYHVLPELPISLAKLMTQRSARVSNGMLPEYREELIAQYIIMGGVKLALPAHFSTLYPNIDYQKATQRVKQFANSISVKIDRIMDYCVGKIFIST
jgi:hypothetical protein